jgi:hypothetical protein
LKKGKLAHDFDRHQNSKKHKINTENFRMELENEFKSMTNEKLSINDTNSKLEICDMDDNTIVTKLDPFIDKFSPPSSINIEINHI